MRLLCDPNPMAYGATSALLSILDHLETTPTFLTRTPSHELIAAEFSPEALPGVDPRDQAAVRDLLTTSSFDAALVISNQSNLDLYLRMDLPVFFVDILFWYGAKEHRIWRDAARCFVETFPPALRRLEAFEHRERIMTVGPLVRLPEPRPAEAPPRSGTLVNIGGATNRWVHSGSAKRYLEVILDALHTLRSALPPGPVTVAAGAAAVDALNRSRIPPGVQLRTFPQPEYLRILNQSLLLLTAPGLNAVFEGLATTVPVAFLPPQNASQVEQLHHYERAGLTPSGGNLDVLVDAVPGADSDVDEETMTHAVLRAIECVHGDPQIQAAVTASIGRSLSHAASDEATAARSVLRDALGAPGGDDVAQKIREWWHAAD